MKKNEVNKNSVSGAAKSFKCSVPYCRATFKGFVLFNKSTLCSSSPSAGGGDFWLPGMLGVGVWTPPGTPGTGLCPPLRVLRLCGSCSATPQTPLRTSTGNFLLIKMDKEWEPCKLMIPRQKTKRELLYPSRKHFKDFPGGSAARNHLPDNAEDMGSIPDPGRCHMPRSS